MKLRRSSLISTGDNPKMLEKLAAGESDVGILELEDGVHETRKEVARQLTARMLRELDWRGRERVVRINSLLGEHGARDIEVVAAGAPDALLLPKVQSAEEVRQASALLARAEEKQGLPAGSIRLWSMIESVRGLLQVEDICAADPRMTAVLFGGGDLAVDLQVKRLSIGAFRRTGFPAFEYAYARGRVVAAARGMGLDPIDIGHSSYMDLDGTRRGAEMSAQMGFAGCIVYSPRQVPTINEVFTPPPEDIAWATEVVTKFEAAGSSEQRAVVVVDGEMIDGPFVLSARQILMRHALVKSVERQRARPA